ncbi:hypothetical protein CEXT_161651 [Caerostris extrusa]|uniref:Uncharacterized protein n=1 Tax=Caerostris extrusa TaxID=172846 RepID=A0AAV4MQN1_CAEEX|nr:hypothetical protein CEXT_161651 [Caerostris extrusa]
MSNQRAPGECRREILSDIMQCGNLNNDCHAGDFDTPRPLWSWSRGFDYRWMKSLSVAIRFYSYSLQFNKRLRWLIFRILACNYLFK